METLLRERRVSFLALVSAAAVGPVAIIHFFGREQLMPPSWVHFAFLAVGATIAALAAIALTTVGARRGDGRTVLLGTAFTAMTAMLAVHGSATPGVLVGPNGVIAFSGAAVLPLGGAVLALSTLPALRRPRSVRPLLLLDLFLVAGIVSLGVVGLRFPDVVPAVPTAGSTAAVALMIAGLVFFGALAVRAVNTYTLTRRRADLAVVCGVVWLGVAIVPQLMLGFPSLGWWLGHVLELVGVAMVGAPVAFDLHRDSQSRPLVGDLRGAELVTAEEAFLGSRVRALMVRLAEKDAYTEGHTRRVALRSVQLGEALGLSPARLRSLAIGGLLHDVGKLTVPDAILQKPGPLDDDEFAVIRSHTERGEDLIRELGGFGEEVRRLVLSHHERLDGSGYPHGLRGDALDLETRILATCDVYDALISTRVYRAAWSVEDALALLRSEAGTAFDPRCVAALESLVEGEHREPLVLRPSPQPAFAA
jgi:HD-GYP domain-containing protein (c-di-GMP phosphodiesterase class II)